MPQTKCVVVQFLSYVFPFFEEMSQITPSMIEILTMQVKETWVKQEADRLEEVKMNVLDLVLEISTISDMSKFEHSFLSLLIIHA